MNPLFRIPIRLQLMIIVAIVAFPAAGIIIYSGIQHRDQAIKHARVDTQNLVELVASEQRLLVASAQQLLVTLAQLPEINEKDVANTNLFLSRILKLHPSIGNIFIADRTGTIWASAAPFTTKITIHDRRYFKNAMATGQLSSGEYQIGRISHVPTLNLGYPYWDSEGKIVGAICVGMSLENYKVLLKQTQVPSRTYMVLIDHKGIVLFGATVPETQAGDTFDQALFKSMQEGPDADTSIAVGIAGDSPRQKRYISYRKLRLQGEQAPYMYIWVGIPVESALSESTNQLVRSMLLFAFVLVSALLLAWFVGKRSISDRITLLETASQNVANGNLQIRVSDLIKGGELGSLSESFDAMARQVLSREQILGEKQHQLEELNLNLEQRIAHAVSDLRKKDQMLIQQGRQAALGEMIGNIAHQWRQPLNTLGLIIQETGMTYGREGFSENLQANTQKAMALIQHMSKTIDDFGSYFKPENIKKLFNVNDAVSKTLDLVEPMMRNMDIDMRFIQIDTAEVYGYANEYAQVLLNIIFNCRDAFQVGEINGQGVIKITAGKENDKSVVTVADNAGGIPENIIDKIFDPYFTTKGPDKGTGIGLYMSKTIIEQHMGGRLTVRNLEGGVEFRIEI